MSEHHVDAFRDRLLTERIADRLGFDALAERLPGPTVYPPYLLAGVVIFVEYGVFDLYNYVFTSKSSFVTSPDSLALPLLVVLAVFGARYIHDSYAEAVVDLGVEERGTDPELFEELIPFRVRAAVYVLVLGVVYAYALFVLGVSQLVEISGVGLVAYSQLVAFPLVYLPALVEFGLSYFAVHAVVPRRIAEADFSLFFYDPRNVGGFAPVGELLKRSYYLYTAALLLWFAQTYAPVVLSQYLSSPYPPPGPILQVALSAAWLVGLLSIAYSMHRVHSVMKAEKDDRIRELESELKSTVEDPYDAHSTNVVDMDRYEQTQLQLEHVRNTQTYPTTFAMWSQIFVSVLLPQALNMAVQLP